MLGIILSALIIASFGCVAVYCNYIREHQKEMERSMRNLLSELDELESRIFPLAVTVQELKKARKAKPMRKKS